jgi:hypothetical protein
LIGEDASLAVEDILGPGGEDDLCTGARKVLGNREAHAAARACDERSFSCDTHRFTIAFEKGTGKRVMIWIVT